MNYEIQYAEVGHHKTIRFKDSQLDMAWEWLWWEISKRPKYVSLIENLSYDEFWICFEPEKRFRVKLLKIHGSI